MAWQEQYNEALEIFKHDSKESIEASLDSTHRLIAGADGRGRFDPTNHRWVSHGATYDALLTLSRRRGL